MSQVTDAEGHVTAYTYDPDGRQIAVTDPSGGVNLTSYDRDGRPIVQTNTDGNCTPAGASRCPRDGISMRYHERVRTTLSLDDDVAAAVQRVREERHVGLSEAVNDLVRAGLAAPAARQSFHQRSARLGLRLDVSNVAEALERLDGPEAR